jgi:nitroreductase
VGTSEHPISGFDLETVDKLLTTTRAVRKRLDFSRPVPLTVVQECLTIALQAPTGSNAQLWRWLVITDPALKEALAALYRDLPPREVRTEPDPPPTAQQERVLASAHFLLEHLGEAPVLVVPCVREAGGPAGWAPSVYPAVWSLILALRSRGLGSVITTAHLYHRQEAAELLGIPEGYAQACLLPIAYYTGKEFRPADRLPLERVCYLNRWGEPLSNG